MKKGNRSEDARQGEAKTHTEGSGEGYTGEHRDAAGGSPKRVTAEHFAPLASFFARMARLRYRPFYGEYNPSCGPHVRCWEISWYRSEECTD